MGGGILGRLFQKPGSGRPAEIAQALKSKDLETEEYRRVAAACLAGLAPGNTMQSYIHTCIRSYNGRYIHKTMLCF